MQDASSTFETAVASHRTWVPSRVRTDWEGGGYNGDGSLDDLTTQVGTDWSVSHDLDDGYPNTVSFVSGTAVPEFEAEMAGRTVSGVPMSAAAYWSPLRTDSPLYGIARDTRPVTLDMGLVTASGPEYVRVFTGQITNTPVKGGNVQLKAISAARTALMKQVLPYTFAANLAGGLNASWIVSWCLFQCGIYAGPKIRNNSTTLYYPMHGSGMRFLDADATYGNQLRGERVVVYETSPANTFPGVGLDGVEWIEGPYVAAPALQMKTALTRRMYQIDPPFNHGQGQPQAFSQSGNSGRLEMWVRGDSADINTVPGGSATVSRMCGLQLFNNTSSASAAMGVDTSRRVYVEVWDGINRRRLNGGTLPTDGAWHFVGAAYDMTADKLWTCLDNSSTSTAAVMSTANLPATKDSLAGSYWLSYLPFSDMTFSTGSNVDFDSEWRNGSSFAPTARVGLSRNNLVVCAETTPREAWELIASYAQTELAMLRADENDMVQYLPLGWWVKSAQQEIRYAIDTSRNAAPFDIDYDPSRIRNAVTVSYNETSIPTWSAELGYYRRAFELQNATEIRLERNSVTDVTFVFGTPAVLLNVDFDILTDEALMQGAFASQTYATFNTAVDGTGSYVGDDITVEVISRNAGRATVRFTNSTSSALYLANDVNVPALVIAGLTVIQTQTYVTESDPTSVGIRGERSLSVSAPEAQGSEAARRLARNLKANLRLPMATVGDESSGIVVTADPRRQPGDLTTLADTETGVSGGLWRVQSVRHALRDAAYTQQLVVRETYPVAVVGRSVVGHSLVGPPQ